MSSARGVCFFSRCETNKLPSRPAAVCISLWKHKSNHIVKTGLSHGDRDNKIKKTEQLAQRDISDS